MGQSVDILLGFQYPSKTTSLEIYLKFFRYFTPLMKQEKSWGEKKEKSETGVYLFGATDTLFLTSGLNLLQVSLQEVWIKDKLH